MEKCLFNTYSDNCCAFCHYHNCAITPHQMGAKKCLQKQCRDFEKNLKHPIWAHRDRMKQKKKQKKQRIDNYVAKIYGQI